MFKVILLFTLLFSPISISTVLANEDMASHLICPCECAMIVSTCECPTAVQVKEEISRMTISGFSEEQIFTTLKVEYGEEILANPEKNDQTPLWVVGILSLFMFAFIGYFASRKPNPDIIPVSNKEMYEQRFYEEYREFVREME